MYGANFINQVSTLFIGTRVHQHFLSYNPKVPPSGDRRGKRGKTMPQAAEDKVFFSKEPQSRLCENSGQDFFL